MAESLLSLVCKDNCSKAFSGVTAIGGGRGIGLSLARAAAELGSDVAVLDILEKPHDEFFSIANDFGVRVKYYR
jgi:sorbose reductase